MDSNHFRIDHDKVAKTGLQNKEWFKATLKYKLSFEQYHAMDFSRFTYMDTGLLREKDSILREFRADSVAKIGVKDMDTEGLFSIIAEHKSTIKSDQDLYLQVFKYHEILLIKGFYPIITVVLIHGKSPTKISPDLQTAFGWTPKMKKVFGKLAFNFGLVVIDLSQETEEDIKDKGGVASPWLFALKHVWNMTSDRLKSVIKLCLQHSKDQKDYFKKFRFLIGYALKASKCSIQEFKKIEDDILHKNKEGQTMPSTYDMLIDEGLAKRPTTRAARRAAGRL